MNAYLQIDNRHTGEWLRLRRVREQGVEVLELEGGVPPGGEGPPEHVHIGQVEEGFVVSGVLTASVDGKRFTVRAGESMVLPADLPHRWWNDGDEPAGVRVGSSLQNWLKRRSTSRWKLNTSSNEFQRVRPNIAKPPCLTKTPRIYLRHAGLSVKFHEC